MRTFLLLTAVAAVTVAVMMIFRDESEGPSALAEEELLGLKEHFKSLDSVSANS